MKLRLAARAVRRGFSLVELAVVLALLSVVAIATLAWQMEQYRERYGVSIGDNLVELDAAVSKSYIIKNYTSLLNGTPIAGFANPYAPTIAELKAGTHLSEAFSPTNLFGSTYAIEVAKVPAGCVAPNCDLQTIVYPSAPILVKGSTRPDSVILASAQTRIGGNAGTSIDDPTVLSGPGSSWTLPNPLGKVGVVAVRGGFNASGLAGFMQTNGVTPITNIVVAGTACAVNNTYGVDSTGKFLTCQSGTWQQQGSQFWRDPVATFAALPLAGNNIGDVRMTTDTGRAFTWTGGIWQALALDQNGDLRNANSVQSQWGRVEMVVTIGELCASYGQGAYARTVAGRLAACVLNADDGRVYWTNTAAIPVSKKIQLGDFQQWVVPQGVTQISAIELVGGGGGAGNGGAASVGATAIIGTTVVVRPGDIFEARLGKGGTSYGGPSYGDCGSNGANLYNDPWANGSIPIPGGSGGYDSGGPGGSPGCAYSFTAYGIAGAGGGSTGLIYNGSWYATAAGGTGGCGSSSNGCRRSNQGYGGSGNGSYTGRTDVCGSPASSTYPATGGIGCVFISYVVYE